MPPPAPDHAADPVAASHAGALPAATREGVPAVPEAAATDPAVTDPAATDSTALPFPDGRHLEALRATGLVAAPRSPSLDGITRIVRRTTGAAVSLFSLIEADRSVFVSEDGVEAAIGAPVREVPLSLSLCQHVVAREASLRLDDTRAHPFACDNAAVTELGVGAYLGVPVRTPEGIVIGSLCAIDLVPHAWTDDDEATLVDLSRLVTDEIALRRQMEEREQSAALVSASDARYRQLLESIHDAFFSVDTEWRFTYLNAEAERLLGHPREALIGRGLWDVYADAVGSIYDVSYRQAIETRRPVSFEAFYAPIDLHLAVRAYPFDEGLSVYFRNVTEQKAAEAAERAATAEAARTLAQLEAVLDTLSEGLIIASPDGTLARWNPAALDLHGYATEAEATGPFATVAAAFRLTALDGRVLPLEEWPMARALRGVSTNSMEVTIDRLDQGWRRTFCYNGALVSGPDGAPLCAVLTVRDTTAAREATAALRQLNETLEARVAERTEEIERASERIERANALLTSRNRELQDFAHVASHDLQEPLRKMRAFADLLVLEHSASLDDEARGFLDKVQSGAERMSRLLSDLLAFSRVTSHGRPYAPIDLDVTAERVVSDLGVRIAETGGEVSVGPLPTVTGDASQLYQLLLNLVQNALKFHRDGVGSRVVVAAERAVESRRRVVRLTVRDDGIGFDEKHRDRIFKPFQRLHGRGTYEGTGMGLAICRRIVDRHGGRIEVASTPGEGTTFTVTLPEVPPPTTDLAAA